MSPVPGHLVPIPMIVATLILSIIGFIGNLMIVLATLVTPNLGSRCNVLISILALCDAIICAYLVHLRILMFIRFYNVTNWKCFWTSIYGLFALNCQSAIGLVIGIDRLLAVVLPIRYTRIPKSIYVVLISVTLIFAFAITYIGYEDSSDAIKVAVCLPPTAYNEKSRKIWIVCSIIIAILVLFVYGAAQIKCRLLSARNTHEQSLQRLKKLLNSLTLVMLMYSSTWFITVLALLATQTVSMSPSLIGIINQQLAWLVIINASTNFFIYYWRAPEYRKAFLDIVSCRCQRTRMFSISVNTQRHSHQLSMSNTAKKADREAGVILY
ncbi:hypothetical protein WR25_17796 [Diploscapter pachys]|uniref:G-protein coupled receptors family 1 profile domain-containing protein n=1 Tax=Diploscapter pachys TaxID=2018661 RepID=A0A2A2KMH0_9BILA|nr:hypothetical protein WR25_17796 [Diploscapter pachys]